MAKEVSNSERIASAVNKFNHKKWKDEVELTEREWEFYHSRVGVKKTPAYKSWWRWFWSWV